MLSQSFSIVLPTVPALPCHVAAASILLSILVAPPRILLCFSPRHFLVFLVILYFSFDLVFPHCFSNLFYLLHRCFYFLELRSETWFVRSHSRVFLICFQLQLVVRVGFLFLDWFRFIHHFDFQFEALFVIDPRFLRFEISKTLLCWRNWFIFYNLYNLNYNWLKYI